MRARVLQFAFFLMLAVLTGCQPAQPTAEQLAAASQSRILVADAPVVIAAAERAFGRMAIISTRDPVAPNQLIAWRRWKDPAEETAALAGNIALITSIVALEVLAGGNAVPPPIFEAKDHLFRGTVTISPAMGTPPATQVRAVFLYNGATDRTEPYYARFWLLLTEALPPATNAPRAPAPRRGRRVEHGRRTTRAWPAIRFALSLCLTVAASGCGYDPSNTAALGISMPCNAPPSQAFDAAVAVLLDDHYIITSCSKADGTLVGQRLSTRWEPYAIPSGSWVREQAALELEEQIFAWNYADDKGRETIQLTFTDIPLFEPSIRYHFRIGSRFIQSPERVPRLDALLWARTDPRLDPSPVVGVAAGDLLAQARSCLTRMGFDIIVDDLGAMVITGLRTEGYAPQGPAAASPQRSTSDRPSLPRPITRVTQEMICVQVRALSADQSVLRRRCFLNGVLVTRPAAISEWDRLFPQHAPAAAGSP